MASEVKTRRRPKVERADRLQLWRDLMALYRAAPRYRNLVEQDLRERWDQVEGLSESESRLVFEAVQEFAVSPGAPGGLRDYVATFERSIMDTLGLARGGKAPTWAGRFVHKDVVPSSGPPDWATEFDGELDPPHEPGPTLDAFCSVHIEVITGSALVRLVEVSPEEEETEVDERILDPPVRHDLVEWETIRGAAHDLVDQAIRRMQAEADRLYPNLGNPAASDARRDTLRLLFLFLFSQAAFEREVRNRWLDDQRTGNERPLDLHHKATRQRMRALARLIEIDLPKRSHQVRQKN